MITRLPILLGVLALNFSVAIAQDFDNVQVKTVKVQGNIYMLQGQGGNIGVSMGTDGVFLVDDQYAPLTDKIISAIAKIGGKEIRFIINTHWHGDHVGGNETIGKTGAVIIAHENVRKRMSTEQVIKFFDIKVPPSPNSALPVVTFTKDINVHQNGEKISISHLKNAHTDGDAVVYFEKSNVVHTGDIYFAGMYPFIDTSSRGSIDGVISGVKHILAIIDEDTKVIPGHGPLSNTKELRNYLKMLENVRERIQNLISQGKSLQEIQNSNPTKDFDSTWGKGFLNADRFIEIVYEDLSSK